jgi:hypothetical protein
MGIRENPSRMSLTPAPRHYVLIFVLSLSLLMLQIATARILSVALLSHYAFVAIPLGITVLRRHGEGLVPWAWSMNGAMSVVASVFAVLISSRVGFTVTMLTGRLTYAVALACMVVAGRVAAAAVGVARAPVASPRGARQSAAAS